MTTKTEIAPPCVLCGEPSVGTSSNGFGEQVPRCADCMPTVPTDYKLQRIKCSRCDGSGYVTERKAVW